MSLPLHQTLQAHGCCLSPRLGVPPHVRIRTRASPARAALPPSSRTQVIMERISTNSEAGGAGGSNSYNGLKRLDQLWSNICDTSPETKEIQEVVCRVSGSSCHSDLGNNASCMFDVLVCGGTLGIFIATALVSRGLRVGIVERNLIKGREQEWNISRKELMELVHVGILSEDDLQQITAIKFNPNRCGFEMKGDVWVEDILNLGVSPAKLLQIMKKRFLSLGGSVFENKCLSSVCVYDDAAILKLTDGDILSSRLVVDSMGNFSPIVKQIRLGRKPDGFCLVVGSCARGFNENTRSDIIFSNSSVKKMGNSLLQYFWEGIALDKLEILRVSFGIFPTYRDSPLPAAFDRIIQVGDASGIQSPVSFGGFGSMTRHLSRLSNGIHEAISGNFVDANSLGLLNPYMPNLSAAWLFQRAMSAQENAGVSSTFINELLFCNFQAMQSLGDSVLRPFLQDVIQFGPLVRTLGSVMLSHPQILPSIFKQVGVRVILDWSVHFAMLGWYTLLTSYVDPILRPSINFLSQKKKYELNRYLEAWKYGSGLDYNQSELKN